MGGIQSSPLSRRNLGRREAAGYTAFGSSATSRPSLHLNATNIRHHNLFNNNNNVGYGTTTTSRNARTVRRKPSVLSQGWSLAKRTATAVLPHGLLSSRLSESGSDATATPPSCRSGVSSVDSRRMSTSRSRDSNLSFASSQGASSLDSNCNYVTSSDGYLMADALSQNSRRALPRPNSKQSNNSFTLFSNRFSIDEELQTKNIFEDDPNNNNNNNGVSPAEAPARFYRLLRRPNHGPEKRSSLSTSSSGASSTESTQSFTLSKNSYNAEKPWRQPESAYSSGLSGSESLEALPLFGRSDIVHASTAELLLGLGKFIAINTRVKGYEPAQLVMWLRSIDRSLMLQGWQDVAFVNPANLVFVYFLVREQLEHEYDDLRAVGDLQSLVRTCLYLSYSYMGNEISYPLKPFISVNENRRKFWWRCVRIVDEHSEDLLRLNASADFFLEVFAELRTYASLHIY